MREIIEKKNKKLAPSYGSPIHIVEPHIVVFLKNTNIKAAQKELLKRAILDHLSETTEIGTLKEKDANHIVRIAGGAPLPQTSYDNATRITHAQFCKASSEISAFPNHWIWQGEQNRAGSSYHTETTSASLFVWLSKFPHTQSPSRREELQAASTWI